MLSPPMGTFDATYTSVTNNENNLSTTAASAAAATAASGTGYTLENIGPIIGFQITRYDMPQSYCQAVASVLEGGAVFKLYYPNYSTFLGTHYQKQA